MSPAWRKGDLSPTADTHLAHAPSAELTADLVRLRRALHRDPEVGIELPRTQARVRDALASTAAMLHFGRSVSSVTAVIQGARPGPVVMLRADMDALPITEAANVTFPSETDGVMHACGHDIHTAMLVGAAHLLSQRRGDLHGAVVLAFQPGEESGRGAEAMIDEGLLDTGGTTPVAAFALHVVSSLPLGLVVSRPGTVLGSSDTARVSFRGTGGHSSLPHLAKDPLIAACHVVASLPGAMRGRLDPFEPVVVSPTMISAGSEAANALADRADLTLSLRTYEPSAREWLLQALPSLLRDLVSTSGVDVDVEVDRGYPVTRNHPAEAEFAAEVTRELLGEQRYAHAPRPLPAAEDFSLVLEHVPGAYLTLGACPPDIDPQTAAPNHAPKAMFDDSVIADGAKLYASLAMTRLAMAAERAE